MRERGGCEGASTDFSKSKRWSLMSLKVRFITVQQELDRKQRPLMIAAVVGAGLNLWFLIDASLDATRPISKDMQNVMILISVVYYLVIMGILEWMARHYLNPLSAELARIRSSVVGESEPV